ncbi:VanZ family protein [Eubacteriales bacterium OttesenSCG-928-M02]|nr:VanZ family protein [Eubacteriales bacterium OttesenSCG-928-M02]
MEVYYYPIGNAMLHFPFLALAFTIPYMVVQYRKLGAVPKGKSLIVFSFFFYLLCAYYLVILPLPDIAVVAQRTGPFTQLVPFQFIRDFLRETTFRLGDSSTYWGALTQGVVLQPFFNLALTIPFGVYLASYFRAGWKKALVMTFLLSLFFEVTQLTGLYGIYPKPYRLFDVDDLFLNTAGGMLGWLVGRTIHILPSKTHLEEKGKERGEPVSYSRRFVADLFDMVLMGVISVLLAFVVKDGLVDTLAYLVYFVGIGALTGGRTMGKSLVKIRMETMGKWGLFVSLLIKYGVWLMPGLAVWILSLLPPVLPLLLLQGAVYPAMFLYTVVDWIKSFSRGKRLWYERLSGTKNVSTLALSSVEEVE